MVDYSKYFANPNYYFAEIKNGTIFLERNIIEEFREINQEINYEILLNKMLERSKELIIETTNFEMIDNCFDFFEHRTMIELMMFIICSDITEILEQKIIGNFDDLAKLKIYTARILQAAQRLRDKKYRNYLSKEFPEMLINHANQLLLTFFPNEKIVNIVNSAKEKKSYLWQNNPDKELPKLFELMVNEYKFIASETTYEQFEAVFTGQPIDEIKPIKWLVAKNLNAYFIEKLINIKKIRKDINNDVWGIAKNCFVNGSNFSQLKDLYGNNKTGKPKNHNLIDGLLNAL